MWGIGIWVLLVPNFLIVALLAIPGADRRFSQLAKQQNVVRYLDVVGPLLPAWIIASTVVATLLFGWILSVNKSLADDCGFRSRAGAEGIILLIWWVALIALLLFGVAMGTAF